MSFPNSFSPTWRETSENYVFGDLANQTTVFVGVQSNLQSKKNYRSDNKRLEMKFFVKKYEIKDFQGFNSANSSYCQKLKDFHQKFW